MRMPFDAEREVAALGPERLGLEAQLERIGHAVAQERWRARRCPGADQIGLELRASLADHLGGFDEVGAVGVDRTRGAGTAARRAKRGDERRYVEEPVFGFGVKARQ